MVGTFPAINRSMGDMESNCGDGLLSLIRQNKNSLQKIARMLRDLEERANLKGFPPMDGKLHADAEEIRPTASSQVTRS